jgi:hypothetical protein
MSLTALQSLFNHGVRFCFADRQELDATRLTPVSLFTAPDIRE